jgi:hypothetical protein
MAMTQKLYNAVFIVEFAETLGFARTAMTLQTCLSK